MLLPTTVFIMMFTSNARILRDLGSLDSRWRLDTQGQQEPRHIPKLYTVRLRILSHTFSNTAEARQEEEAAHGGTTKNPNSHSSYTPVSATGTGSTIFFIYCINTIATIIIKATRLRDYMAPPFLPIFFWKYISKPLRVILIVLPRMFCSVPKVF